MPERPVECSQCKKTITVIYKEIVDESVICTEMCTECPVLQQKLHGATLENAASGKKEGETGLCCGNCRTTFEAVKMGNPLGCSQCYEVFADLLVSELITSNHISPRLKQSIKSGPIHVGKAPNKPAEIAPSNRLSGLNEALNEALKRENYEQAAWLRDQIKALMDKSHEGKN